MRVLHLLKTADGAVWAWRQIRELAALGVEAHVVLPSAGTMNQRYGDLRVPVHLLDCDLARMASPRRFANARRALRSLVDELRPDLIHSHFVGTTMLARLALGRDHAVPRIFQVPGPLHLESRFIRWGEVHSAGPKDTWIASCALTRQLYLSSGVDRARVGLSSYGTDVDNIPVHRGGGTLRQDLGLAITTKVVGMVAYAYRPKRWLGQTRGIKGHEDLIDAVAVLQRRGMDVALVVAGSAWTGAERYFASVQHYGRQILGSRAIFLGRRDDVMDLYPSFDVAVHPSLSENLGGAAESLLAGVPTVATNVGGLPDIVIPGRTGWVCPPRSPQQLASAIAEALNDPAEGARRAGIGRQLIISELDVRKTAAQVLALYRAVLEGGSLDPNRSTDPAAEGRRP